MLRNSGETGRAFPRGGVALAVLGFALAVRLLFVGQELRAHSVDEIVTFNWDSREYVHLAHNLATTGHYVDDANRDAEQRRVSHFFGLLRTPGYPAFLAVFDRWGGSLAGALWVQAILGSLVPLGVLLIGQVMFRSERIAVLAAAAAAVSSTGIGLSGMFLVDGLFACSLLGGWALLYLGISGGRIVAFIGSGLLFAAGVLVKPGLLYWPLLVPLLAWLIGRSMERTVRWRWVAVAALIPVATVGAWCLRNVRAEGGFTYCIVDAQNLRHFLTPLTEEYGKANGEPAAADLMRHHAAVRGRDWDDMVAGVVTPVQLGTRQRAESFAVLRAHPLAALRCLVHCSWSIWGDGWAYTRDELSSVSPVKVLVASADRVWCVLGRAVVIPLALLALVEPVLNGLGLRDRRNRRRFYAAMALLVTFAYFLVLCGTSFAVGFRTLYPAEFAIFLLTAAGAETLARLVWTWRAATNETVPELFAAAGE